MPTAPLGLDERPCAGEERRQDDGRVLFVGFSEAET